MGALLTRKGPIGTKIPKWNESPKLSKTCQRSQFWFQLWCDSSRPKIGTVNEIRLYTKCQFSKCLVQYLARIIKEDSAHLKINPSLICQFVRKNNSNDK